MTKEQIQKEIQEMDNYIPISKIEENLKMPPTTLQKVLKGKRELPKKWYKVLETYFVDESKKIETSVSVNGIIPIKPQNKPHTDTIKDLTGETKVHKLWKQGDPSEGSNAFYLRYGVRYYDEI